MLFEQNSELLWDLLQLSHRLGFHSSIFGLGGRRYEGAPPTTNTLFENNFPQVTLKRSLQNMVNWIVLLRYIEVFTSTPCNTLCVYYLVFHVIKILIYFY